MVVKIRDIIVNKNRGYLSKGTRVRTSIMKIEIFFFFSVPFPRKGTKGIVDVGEKTK